MANRLTIWLVAGLLLGGVYFVVHLNSAAVFYGSRRRPQLSVARERASRLASEWQLAERTRRVNAARTQLVAQLHDRAVVDSPSVTLIITPSDRLSRGLTDTLRDGLGEAWRRLGLGVTKVGVGVVLNLDVVPVLPGMERPGINDQTQLLLLPDSLAPTICVVMVPFDTFGLARARSARDVAGWLAGTFDACAYYARFGVPGPRVRNWLASRKFDIARTPNWNTEAHRSFLPGLIDTGPWEVGYGLPPTTLACFDGRASACAAGLRRGDAADRSVPEDAVALSPAWRYETQSLVDGEVFLSRVLKEVGPQRFLEFWTTTLPVDSALTLALRQSVGEWTARWQRSFPHSFHVTPRLGIREALAGIVQIALAIGCAVWIGSRREVG